MQRVSVASLPTPEPPDAQGFVPNLRPAGPVGGEFQAMNRTLWKPHMGTLPTGGGRDPFPDGSYGSLPNPPGQPRAKGSEAEQPGKQAGCRLGEGQAPLLAPSRAGVLVAVAVLTQGTRPPPPTTLLPAG